MVKGQKTTIYRQGKGWIVSSWSEQYQCYTLSNEMSYSAAREIVGRENKKGAKQ
jgi:hypothetical protein